MQTSRRQLITGGAAVAGLAGLGLAGPARAAAYNQDVSDALLGELAGVIDIDDEGYCVTALDLEVGAAKANVVMTQMDSPGGVPVFGVAAADVAGLIDEARPEAYRLRSLCSQGNGQVMMLFELAGPPAPEQFHLRQTASEYQKMVTAASRTGLEPVYVSVDNQDGAPRYTSLLRRSTTAWEARHNVKRGELTDLALAMKAKGLRPARCVPYLLGGELRFCTLYRPAGLSGWESWIVDEADLPARHQTYEAKGYALQQAIRFVEAGKPRWSTVWQQPSQTGQALFWGS
ncbi:MAG: hypothetical protein GC145_05585 [Caulobacter sp.]|nr:hypothetical protein [Caulobacter sp.]